MFSKILIANRGEIAVRIIRACDELGIASVAVYSELDRDAPHVARAGEAHLLGGAAPAESYLNVERILEVARASGAEAVHPGYGFLAENAPFARACEEAGIVFIGPPADAIDAMGSKTRARELMRDAGVPIVPGTVEPVADLAAARKIVDDDIGYPVAVKAAGGGGGKGFRVALSAGRARGGVRGRRARGREVLLRRDGLPRALPARPAPRRGPDPRRRARHDDPPRRARLLDPAPPPEARRGVAGAVVGRRRGAARADREDRRRGGRGGGLPRGGHRRGTAGVGHRATTSSSR